MTSREIVEIIAALTVPIAIIGLLINRWLSKTGLGVRVIQFLAVVTFSPIVLILALEKIIDGSTVAALVGAFVGYLFSNIADFGRKRTVE